MKYILIIGDGMADNPVPTLDNKTPLQHAAIPVMDGLAAKGEVGNVVNCPAGLPAGSDTAILSIFGADPNVCYTGRSPLEAAATGIQLQPGDISYRCNMVTYEDSDLPFEEKRILSHSGGSIEGDQSIQLITDLFRDPAFQQAAQQAGMVVHPAPGHPDGTLVNALLFHCGQSLSGINGQLRPGIVHRIDRDTSGLIIAAKNDAAHLALAAQLADHTLARTYECLSVGNFRQDSGTVDAPIGRSRSDRKKMAVVAGGRPAITHWEVLARYPGVTHLRCRLETGRTHQIRVHLAYIGHPILGDTVYGNRKPVPGLTGQCLHATGLRFLHPRTGRPVELTCPRPEEFERMLVKLQKRI